MLDDIITQCLLLPIHIRIFGGVVLPSFLPFLLFCWMVDKSFGLGGFGEWLVMVNRSK